MASKRKDRLPGEQKAFWLTYNLETPNNDFTDYEEAVRCSREGKVYLDSWQVKNNVLRGGERVFILRQGNNPVIGRPGRGIVARGITTSDSDKSTFNRDGSGEKNTFRVDVSIDSVIAHDEPPMNVPIVGRNPVIRFSGWPIDRDLLQETEQLWSARFDIQPDVLSAATNKRERVICSILERREQQKFRNELIKVYGQCVLTGCTTHEALEAAHIMPCAANGEDHVQNGLLLRADLHTLFDLDLLRIDPDTRQATLAPGLAGGHYKRIEGKPLIEEHVSTDLRAGGRYLRWRFENWKERTDC